MEMFNRLNIDPSCLLKVKTDFSMTMLEKKNFLRGMDLDEKQNSFYLKNRKLVLEIDGVLWHRVDPFYSKYCGYIDTFELEQGIKELVEKKAGAFDTLILHFNTPGGLATYIPEISQTIANLGVKTIAFTDNLMASAGYYMAAGCDEIVTTRSANVGSIGTICQFSTYNTDEIKEYNFYTFKEKALKAIGNPYEKLTEEQKEFMQDMISADYNEFANFVAKNRNLSREQVDDTKSACVPGYMAEYLVDRTVNNINDLIEED